jgi:hypothetical protein
LVDRLLTSTETAHLALIFRSDEGTLPAQRERMATNLTSLLSHPRAERLRFVGPDQALQLLGHASVSS